MRSKTVLVALVVVLLGSSIVKDDVSFVAAHLPYGYGLTKAREVVNVADTYGLDVTYFLAVLLTEDRWGPAKMRSYGSGLLALLRKRNFVSVEPPRVWNDLTKAGAKLHFQLVAFRGDEDSAAMAYLLGPTTVRENGIKCEPKLYVLYKRTLSSLREERDASKNSETPTVVPFASFSDGVMPVAGLPGRDSNVRKGVDVSAQPVPPSVGTRRRDMMVARIPFYNPRLSYAERVKIADAIMYYSTLAGFDPLFVFSIIAVESSFNPDAVSPKGAKGLMQLTDRVAEDVGVDDPFDPEESIRGGVSYLCYLRSSLGKDWEAEELLAAYNCGLDRVLKSGGVPKISETEDYVRKVLRLYKLLKGRSQK